MPASLCGLLYRLMGIGADRPELFPQQVGLWDLMQMPHGGELLVCTYRRADAKLYFGAVGPEDLIFSDDLIRYRMRAVGEH